MGVPKHDWPGDDELVSDIVAAGGPNRYASSRGLAVGTLYSHLDRKGLRGRVLAGSGHIQSQIAAAREQAENAARAVHAARQGVSRPGAEVRGDRATVTSAPAPDLGDLETLIRERGLDPDDWDVVNAKLNEWDALAGEGEVTKLRQLTVNLKRKTRLDWLFPASDVAPRPLPRPTMREEGEPERIVFFPDQHAPYHDEGLHYLAMCHIDDWKPHRIVNLGDICDFPTISRHKDNPAYFASATACVDGAISIINDQRTVAPDAIIDLIEGNHDARPRNELLARAERMYELRPGVLPGDDVPAHPWSLQHLLSLDRFHVNFVGPEIDGDNYFQGLLEVTPDIAAIHGFLTGAGSEKATAERLGMSVVFGHIHTQIVRHITKHKGRERVGEYVAVSPGTMRATRGGGGFAWNPNWQQGYLTASVWPDGQWTYDMARFDGHRLTWRDKRF